MVQNEFILRKKGIIASSGIGSEANFEDLSEGKMDKVDEGLTIHSSRKHKEEVYQKTKQEAS